MAVANTLDYYNTATITTVKSSTVQAPGVCWSGTVVVDLKLPSEHSSLFDWIVWDKETAFYRIDSRFMEIM